MRTCFGSPVVIPISQMVAIHAGPLLKASILRIFDEDRSRANPVVRSDGTIEKI